MTDVKTPLMRVFASLFILLSVSISSHSAHAGTTTADFLKWERKSQISYLNVAIGMAATIASRIRPKMARCLNDWYYAKNGLKQRRNAEILKVMPKYTEFHPMAVVVGYLEGVCGSFKED